jgi:hypothetical protein
MSDFGMDLSRLPPVTAAPEVSSDHRTDARDIGHASAVLSQASAVSAHGQISDNHQSCTVDTANATVTQRDGMFYVVVPQDSAAMASAANATPQQIVAPQSLAMTAQDLANPLAQQAAAAAPLVILMTNGRPIYVNGRYIVPAKSVNGEPIGATDPELAEALGEITLEFGSEQVTLVITADDIAL